MALYTSSRKHSLQSIIINYLNQPSFKICRPKHWLQTVINHSNRACFNTPRATHCGPKYSSQQSHLSAFMSLFHKIVVRTEYVKLADNCQCSLMVDDSVEDN